LTRPLAPVATPRLSVCISQRRQNAAAASDCMEVKRVAAAERTSIRSIAEVNVVQYGHWCVTADRCRQINVR